MPPVSIFSATDFSGLVPGLGQIFGLGQTSWLASYSLLSPFTLGFLWGSTGRLLAVSFGVLFAVIAIGLFIVSRTKWGQDKSLTNCIIFAVLAHVWILMYAYGTRIDSPGTATGNSSTGFVSFELFEMPLEHFSNQNEAAADSFDLSVPETLEVDSPFAVPVSASAARSASIDIPETLAIVEPDLPSPLESFDDETNDADAEDNAVPNASNVASHDPIPITPANLLRTASSEANPDSVDPEWSNPNSSIQEVAASSLANTPTVSADNINPDHSVNSNDPALNDASTASAPAVPAAASQSNAAAPIDPYQLRLTENKTRAAYTLGGDETTEQAVALALRWLAANQEPDGSWNAARHGAGRETKTLEHDRQGTGAKADTGMTGLAILCFLGAGNTHLSGEYAMQVRRGLSFLIGSQMPSGDLAGINQVGGADDVLYARMYCHGMATLALAEAYAMTGDPALAAAVERGIGYTLRAQNPQTGGWRYHAYVTGDPGDLSQFGWQAMALVSSEQRGNSLPPGTRQRLAYFLERVSAGRFGGLAVYRPVPGQLPTPAMTAEGLALKLMLHYPITDQAKQEAQQYLLQHLPGSGETNLYYWYYASLALFQYQDYAWANWNQAMKRELTESQVRTGPMAGSWNPHCIWAGYGGRVYSTAMACLCLEVYYRYLPIYRHDYIANQPNPTWK